MKRILLAVGIIVAIIVLLAPTIVFAGSTVTTTVTGHLGITVEITAPSAISFSNFTTGWNSSYSATPGTVTTNATTWSVTAADQNTTTHPGCMLSGSNYLSGAFQISSDGVTYASAATGITYNNPTSLPMYVKQNILATDKTGDYTITIKFTASGS